MTTGPTSIRTGFVALTACLALAGCAGSGRTAMQGGPGSVRTPAGESLTAQAAMDRVVVGQSSKAEVAAALGPAIVIAFDSGYEVWVYRWAGAEGTIRAATELVLLFDPSGRVTKLRLRPGYPPRLDEGRPPRPA